MNKKRVAAIVTEYRHNSHAEMIVGRLLGHLGYEPRVKVVSLFTDQVPANDMSREVAQLYNVPIYSTIEGAIAHGFPDDPVEGIVVIGEHGKYEWNEKGQHLYPRRRFMEETFRAIDRLGLRVPVFLDKHLAFDQRDAQWIFDQIARRRLPFMGGSSVPYRQPIPRVAPAFLHAVKELFVVSYGGNESYGYHAMEVLQSLAERRKGAKSGIAAVEAWSGDEMWRAMERGEWPEELLLHALSGQKPITPGFTHPRDVCSQPALFKLSYADGTVGYVAQLETYVSDWSFAARHADGEIWAASYTPGEGRPFPHFDRFTELIEQLIVEHKPPCPPERILLTTGMINAAMEALFRKTRIATPELAVAYTPFMENGEVEERDESF